MSRLAIILLGCLASAWGLEGSYSILTSTSTGLAVGMNLYLPPGYGQAANAERRYPLMVFLGGAGERGDPTDATVVLQKSTVWGPSKEIRYSGRDFPFIVVTPISTQWYSSLPAQYEDMLTWLTTNARVDADRVYVTGACAGASGVMEFAQVHPDQIAAIVPCITQTPTPWAATRLRDMPTWFFHAYADPDVSRQQTITWADAIANAGGGSGSCMDTYPYGTAPGGGQTYNPDNHTGSYRSGQPWNWVRYTRSADDSLLLFTMMATDLHNVWHYAVNSDVVLRWMAKQRRQAPFSGVPASLPGRIQAERFDFGGHGRAYYDTTIANSGGSALRDSVNAYDGSIDREQVDLGSGGSGVVLTGTEAGEWLEYTVDVASGSYELRLKTSANTAAGSARLLRADGTVLAGPFAVPQSSGFTTTTVASISLDAGVQTLRLAIDAGGFDLDWFEVIASSGPADLVIDNRQTDRVSSSGPWAATSYTAGYYATDYLSAAPDTAATATFRPTLPRAGWYEVSVWHPSSPSRGVATVSVEHAGAVFTTQVDQRNGGGAWQSIGVLDFQAGSADSLTISSAGAGGYVSADAVRFQEREAAPVLDLIIDNPDRSRVTASGPWTLTSYTPGFYGADYLSAAPGSDCVATFRPNLPRAGFFAVSMRYPANPSRGISPVSITHDGGVFTTSVDQRRDGGTWVPLGTFAFAAGPGSAVTVRSLGAGGYVSADAVRFEEVQSLPTLDLVIDNDDAGRVTLTGGWSATTSAPGYFGANYVSTAPGPDKQAVYRPNLPRAGTFTVSIWYPATPSRGISPVTVAYGDGDEAQVFQVDQRTAGGQWNVLGTFPFAAGSGPAITIAAPPTGGWIGADAIRLVETTGDPG